MKRYNLRTVLLIFATISMFGCGNNPGGKMDCKSGTDGVLKELPSIACSYYSQLKAINEDMEALEESATNEGLSEKLIAEAKELEEKTNTLMDKGKKELEDYIVKNDFNIPTEANVDGFFEINANKVKGAVINKPYSTIINLTTEIGFNKNLKIGYKGDVEKLVLIADFLDSKGNVLLSQRYFRSVQNMGKPIQKGKSETIHCNPEVQDLGSLAKIIIKLGS